MKKPTNSFVVTLIALFFGIVAGSLASITTTAYLDENISSIINSQEVDLANSIYDKASLVIRDAKKVVVSQDVKIEETAASLQPILISAFKKGDNDYYILKEADAFGLILSSDGWALLNGLKETSDKNIIKNYSIVSYDKKIYEIDKAFVVKVTGDGNIFLVHLKGASNLPVRQIAQAANLKPGVSVILLSSDGRTLLSSIVSKKRPSIILDSDRPDISLSLANSINDDFANALVFNLGGDFIGWVDGNNEVRPNYVFTPAWKAFIAKQEASFPSLGVNYLDLSSIKAPNLKIEKGAWLKTDDKNQPAIIAGGAAAKAGLKEGDVITRINNQELDRNNDLAEVLSSYLAGDKIILTYDRDGALQDAEVILEEAK